MLERTLRLLEDIAPGTYIQPQVECYDEAEIAEFGALLHRLLYSPSTLRRRLQEIGVTLVPANHYSEIPLLREIELTGSSADFLAGFDRPRLIAQLSALMPYSAEFDPPADCQTPDQFFWSNGAFSYSDAMAYYCLVRQLRPKTIIEIGCGWSSLVADAALRANGAGRLICVDPFPQPFLSKIATVCEIINQPVQSLAPEFFNENLADGDILFIDSTHTVKHESDCVHLYLKVLPVIAHDIAVQVHDIFLPFPLPVHWLRDLQVYWTEQYLLYAYLLDNPRTEIIFGSNYHYQFNRVQLAELMRGRYPPGGGSLWFRQHGSPPSPGRRLAGGTDGADAGRRQADGAVTGQNSGTVEFRCDTCGAINRLESFAGEMQRHADAAAPTKSVGEKFLLSDDIDKVVAVMQLADRAGVTIGNPWQSATIADDIRRLSEAIGGIANKNVRFARHDEVSGVERTTVFCTPVRRFPAPRAANTRHAIFAGLPDESYDLATPDFDVLRIPGGYFCQYLGAPLIVAADGQTVIGDYSSNYAGLVHLHPHRLRDCIAGARDIDGTVVPIADDVQSANIFHWVADWLPRLAFLGENRRRHDLFVATAALPAGFQHDSLRLCGIAAERVIPVGNFAAVRARELLVPSNLGATVHPGFTAAPWALAYLRSTLGLGAIAASGFEDTADRLYISRRDAGGRRVVNEAELVERLAASGYRQVVLSELPLARQIALFARARRVVGVHGAGHVHIAFAQPGTRLLEILPESYALASQYIVAVGSGAEYLGYVADHVVPGVNVSFDDVVVDVDDFEARCRDFYE